ncbi:hypothetical protein [Streptomyces sp. NPDC101181]|uniref:hypothetical protein n=1 Tax=Streptomyces sp. NPDC101181 TaxID=3366125 RepID=UPI0038250CA0
MTGSTAPLAGHEAGIGRARPGRSLTPLELARVETRDETPVGTRDRGEAEQVVDDGSEVPVFTPPPDAFTDPARRSGQALDAAAVRQVQQLSLGSGIALVGLGLGFLAFRMRRTA